MGVMLDEALIDRHRRKPREDTLTIDKRIAINLFWRKGVKATTLAKVFHVSKNTLYYRALTGDADSYPNSAHLNQAAETNALIDRMGEREAWERYVTDDMVIAVNTAMAEEIERRETSVIHSKDDSRAA